MTTPSADELLAGAHVVSVPLRVRFRGVEHREALLLRGPAGWGEWSPFLEYGPAESARWLQAAVEAAWLGWPAPVRGAVPVNATVPAVGPEEVPDVLARFDGCTTAKVKVAERPAHTSSDWFGGSLREDLARVAAVREAMGPHARVRIDANGGWSLEQAEQALAALVRYDLEYAEQPCAQVHDLAALRVRLARAGVDVPVAADESIRKAEDPYLVRDLDAADVIVVKAAPLGGVRRALRIIEEVGLPAVVSSALDTSVGMRAGAALAGAMPRLDHACGLGTVALLAADVVREPLLPRAGQIALGEPVEPDEEMLTEHAAPPQRVAWWHARLRAAHARLR